MILYLIRHGETTYNRDSLALGRADVPLTELGRRQAAAVGAKLAAVPVDRILSSPLERARLTAGAVAGERGIAVELRDELVEMDVGVTEGLALPRMRESHAELLSAWAAPQGFAVKMPSGESLLDVDARVASLLDELRLASEQTVAVVSHNFVLRVMLCRLLGLDLSGFRSMSVDLASVSTLSLRGDRVAIQSLNDCCHLELLEP